MADVIREYVVGLGYQINEADRRRWTEWLRGAQVRAGQVARSVAVVGVGLTGLAAVGVAAVSRLSAALEQLHHAAQRSGTSADRLRGFAYAVGQMGGTADEARASVEAFGRALRTNPGIGGLAAALGAPTRDALGRARDTVDVMEDLGARFARMPFYVANQYAEAFGFDIRTLEAMIASTRQTRNEYNLIARAFGLDLPRTAREAALFGNAMRRLQVTFEVLYQRVVQTLGPAIREGLDRVQRWVIANQGAIVRAVERIGEGIGWLLRRFGDFLAWLAEPKQQKIFQAFLADTMEMLGRIVALIRSAAQFLGIIERPPARAPDGTPLPPDRRTGVQRFGDEMMRAGRRLWEHNFGPRPNATPAPEPQRQRGIQAMSFFMSPEGGGYTREQAAALVAQIERESSFNPNATHDGGIGFGILGWNNNGESPGNPGRLTRLGQFIGRDPRTASFEEQLRFMTHELRTNERPAGERLRGTVTAAQAAAQLSREYVRPRDRDGEANWRAARGTYWQAQGTGGTGPLAGGEPRLSPSVERALDDLRRGVMVPAAPPAVTPAGVGAGGPVNLTQNNTITVTGVTEPREAAKAVTEGQSRVNGDLVRNFSAVAR